MTRPTTNRRPFRHYARAWLILLATMLVLSLLCSWLFSFKFGFSDVLVWVVGATLGLGIAGGSDLWKSRRSSLRSTPES